MKIVTRKTSAFVTCLAALSITGIASPAIATDSSPVDNVAALSSGVIVSTEPSERTASEEKSFLDEITLLAAQDKLTPERMEELDLTAASAPEPAPVAKPGASLMTLRKTTSPVTPMYVGCGVYDPADSANDMTLPAPKIVVNGSSRGAVMYAIATFQWKNPPMNDCPPVKSQIGGPDGFAISLNKAVTNKGVSFLGCNALGKCHPDEPWLETNGKYGAGFGFQDWGGGLFSKSYKGTLTYSFTTNLSKCVQAFSKYGHSWDKTSLNGFSIGPWSVGVSWSSASAQWQKSSQAGSYRC